MHGPGIGYYWYYLGIYMSGGLSGVTLALPVTPTSWIGVALCRELMSGARARVGHWGWCVCSAGVSAVCTYGTCLHVSYFVLHAVFLRDGQSITVCASESGFQSAVCRVQQLLVLLFAVRRLILCVVTLGRAWLSGRPAFLGC